MRDVLASTTVALVLSAMAVGLTASVAIANGGGRVMTIQEMAETTGTVCCWNTYAHQCGSATAHNACDGCEIGGESEPADGCMTYAPDYTDLEATWNTFYTCGSDTGTEVVECESAGSVLCYKRWTCITSTAAREGQCISNNDDSCQPGVFEEDNCYWCSRSGNYEPLNYPSYKCPGGETN